MNMFICGFNGLQIFLYWLVDRVNRIKIDISVMKVLLKWKNL